MTGQRIMIGDRYELRELAGQGGMATVWRGVMHGAAGFTRPVAVKKIKPEFHAIQNYIDMFIEEARVGSDLAHPNIVQIHDFVIDQEGSYYLIMEWVEGIDFGSFARAFHRSDVPVPWQYIAAIAVGSLRGLGAAHERRRVDGSVAPVIHRDVSPQNILLGINGIAKLTDFGLARARDRAYSLTAPGTVKGKLSYLAPEVSYGKSATPLSDLFSMGNLLWEALTGQKLFQGLTDLDTFKKIRKCEVPSLARLRPDIPSALADAITKALARDPGDRYPSARIMARAVVEVLHDAKWREDAHTEVGEMVSRIRQGRKLRTNLLFDELEAMAALDALEMKSEAAMEPARGPALLDGGEVDIQFTDPVPASQRHAVASDPVHDDETWRELGAAGPPARTAAADTKSDSIHVEFTDPEKPARRRPSGKGKSKK